MIYTDEFMSSLIGREWLVNEQLNVTN